MASTMHLYEIHIFRGVRPKTFDGNHRIIEGPFIHITETSGGKRVGTDVEEVRGRRV